jgi:hypothetical protein
MTDRSEHSPNLLHYTGLFVGNRSMLINLTRPPKTVQASICVLILLFNWEDEDFYPLITLVNLRLLPDLILIELP